jgi:hypothetical protein
MSALRPVPNPLGPGPDSLNVVASFAGRSRELSGPGLRTLLNIAGQWQLTEVERLRLLGSPPRSTYHQWRSKALAGEAISLPLDTLLRISAVLGIHKALRILFRTEQEGLHWLRQPNRSLPFAGATPMRLLLNGTQDGIMQVRRFLDAMRGGQALPPTEADADAPAITDAEIVFR